MSKKQNRTEDGKILIKKYGNRRLYSTFHSRYFTLKELEEVVRGGENIVVVDVSTGEDITSQVLTQILVEGDQAGKIPVPFLQKIIRQGDTFVEGLLEKQSNIIEKSMDTAMKTQEDMMGMFQQMMSKSHMWSNPFLYMSQESIREKKDQELQKLRERIERMEELLKKKDK